jgi:hypothetical protein
LWISGWLLQRDTQYNILDGKEIDLSITVAMQIGFVQYFDFESSRNKVEENNSKYLFINDQ